MLIDCKAQLRCRVDERNSEVCERVLLLRESLVLGVQNARPSEVCFSIMLMLSPHGCVPLVLHLFIGILRRCQLSVFIEREALPRSVVWPAWLLRKQLEPRFKIFGKYRFGSA